MAKTNQKSLETIGEISRAFYESLVLRFRYHLKQFEAFVNKKVEILHIVGGGINNRLFCQWISDALGIPVIAGPVETTSVGNLLMQLKAAGEINDITEGRKISLDSSKMSYYEPADGSVWDDAYERYIRAIL